jgi:hypothetical protein
MKVLQLPDPSMSVSFGISAYSHARSQKSKRALPVPAFFIYPKL